MTTAVAAAAAASWSINRLNPVLYPVSLTELLETNDPSLWKLKLYKHPTEHFDSLPNFIHALQQNSVVTSVEVTWRFLRNLTDHQRVWVLETIGSLGQLQELSMEVVGPTNVLTAALLKCHARNSLKSLTIGKLRFSSNQDVQELALALRGCLSLKLISLSSLQVMVQGNHVMDADGMVWFQETTNNITGNGGANDEEGAKLVLDPLLEAMAALPRLHHIRLEHYLSESKRIQSPKEESLRSLCRAPRKALIFNSCGLSDQQCLAMAHELKENQIQCKGLSILVVTRNLQISSHGWDAFVDMLEHNYSILDFHQGEEGQSNAPSTEQIAKIEYFTKLNNAGRRRLLRGDDGGGSSCSRREAWMDFLVRGRDDIDLLFFALQTNPSLCL